MVAVVVADEAGGRVFRLPQDKAAKSCRVVSTLNALETWFVVLEQLLAKQGAALLDEGLSALTAFRIGRKRKAVRKDFADIARNGFANTSALSADAISEQSAADRAMEEFRGCLKTVA